MLRNVIFIIYLMLSCSKVQGVMFYQRAENVSIKWVKRYDGFKYILAKEHPEEDINPLIYINVWEKECAVRIIHFFEENREELMKALDTEVVFPECPAFIWWNFRQEYITIEEFDYRYDGQFDEKGVVGEAVKWAAKHLWPVLVAEITELIFDEVKDLRDDRKKAREEKEKRQKQDRDRWAHSDRMERERAERDERRARIERERRERERDRREVEERRRRLDRYMDHIPSNPTGPHILPGNGRPSSGRHTA